MRPSWNQRRAIPVVMITTFQVGVSGVASRSRLTTPTFSGAWRIVSAMLRIASVLPVPVQAKGQLDRLTGGPCRSDHDDSPSRGLGCEECLRIGREEVVAGDTHCWNIEKREAPCLGGCGDRNSHCLPAVPSRISRTTSPDSAWRFVLFFE